MKALGRVGRQIPMPPRMIRSWRDWFRDCVGLALVLAGTSCLHDLVRNRDHYLAALDRGWIAAAQQLATAALVAVIAGVVAAGFVTLIRAAFSGLTRKRIGLTLERDVASMTAGELAQAIAVERDELVPNDRLRDAHAQWLAWLEAQLAARPVEAIDRPPEWFLRPVPAVQIMKLCIGGVLLALAIWVGVVAVRGHEIGWFMMASAIGLAGLGVWLIASMWTLRIQLTPERLELRHFWRARWAVARERAEVRASVVGDGVVTPGYAVFDTQTGAPVGQLPGTLFRAAHLQTLAALFPPNR